MDNVTHTLFGLTLAATPLGRRRGATAALVLACNAPDIDIVATLGGTQAYMRWHRGPTHGLLGVVGLGIAVAAIVAGVDRFLTRQTDGDVGSTATARSLLALSMFGVVTHILMDLPTSYGTRLLSPFDWHWFAFDWLPIIDIYLLMALAAALVFARLTPEMRRHNAVIALVLMAANYAVRGAAHDRALALAPRLFGPTLPQACQGEEATGGPFEPDRWPRPVALPSTGRRCLVQLAAMPTFISPFHWRIVAQMSNGYELQDLNVLDARFRREPGADEVLWRTALRSPNEWSPPVRAAAGTPAAQTFLGFSRFPDARVFPGAGGDVTVRWTDMRFAGGLVALNRPEQPSPFAIVVRVDPDGRILSQGVER